MATSQVQSHLDPRKVFVIHGRNERARKAIFDQLRAFRLDPIEWSEARSGTGQATPNIQAILDHAFSTAQAFVVLFTPDEEVRLKGQYRRDGDEPIESVVTEQARPNVLWEGGMAYGRDPGRTIIVEIGSLRPFTDISGLHTIRMDGSVKQVKMLGDSLTSAGCTVNLNQSQGGMYIRGAMEIGLVAPVKPSHPY